MRHSSLLTRRLIRQYRSDNVAVEHAHPGYAPAEASTLNSHSMTIGVPYEQTRKPPKSSPVSRSFTPLSSTQPRAASDDHIELQASTGTSPTVNLSPPPSPARRPSRKPFLPPSSEKLAHTPQYSHTTESHTGPYAPAQPIDPGRFPRERFDDRPAALTRCPPNVPILLPEYRYCRRRHSVRPPRAHHCHSCGTVRD